jgi:hypothetical protein
MLRPTRLEFRSSSAQNVESHGRDSNVARVATHYPDLAHHDERIHAQLAVREGSSAG